MKILHTSDWHLGQRFMEADRTEEHERFLKWLVQTVNSEQAELLIVAGDIFDTAFPPKRAEELYYNFLMQIARQTACENVVVIGGNHDAPSTLNAPRALLKMLNVHVVGGCVLDSETNLPVFEEEIIEIRQRNGDLKAVVCAVPFLRDRDLRSAVSGEGVTDIESKTKAAIVEHYRKIGELAEVYKKQGVPVIATGHLYAAGGQTTESEREVHIGNAAPISGADFPAVFDYVALGHLHRPQKVAAQDRIRYSGSPIPLSFSEAADRKIVLLVEINEKGLKQVEEIEIPNNRKLVLVRGSAEKVKEKLAELVASGREVWAAAEIEMDSRMPGLERELLELTAQTGVSLLKIKPIWSPKAAEQYPKHSLSDVSGLNELSPTEVFQRICTRNQLNPEMEKQLSAAFRLLLEDAPA